MSSVHEMAGKALYNNYNMTPSNIFLLFCFNVAAILVSATPTPFDQQNGFRCIQRGKIISVGPQKHYCTMHGKSICGQLPLFQESNLLCNECCKEPENKGKIKIKDVGPKPEKQDKVPKGKSKAQRVNKSGLVSSRWKDSTIVVSVLSVLIISVLIGVILKQSKRSSNSGVPIQETEEATKPRHNPADKALGPHGEELELLGNPPNDGQAQYAVHGDSIVDVDEISQV